MAIQTGMIKYSGRIGDVVGYVWDGRNLVRRARTKGQGATPSPAQARQRARWREVATVAKAANAWTKRYLSPTLKTSAYNHILSANASYLRREVADAQAIRLPHTFFSASPSADNVTLSGRTLTYTLGALPAGVSEVLALVYVPAAAAKSTGELRAFTAVIKASGAQSLDIPLDLTAGDTVYLYLQGGDGEHKLSAQAVYSVSVEQEA